MIVLRLGDYRDVLAGEEVDCVIVDPPFGARTHAAWREGGAAAKLKRGAITYEAWTPDDVHALVSSWSPRTRGWIVGLTSHDLAPAWQDAYEAAGRYSFAPLPCVTWGGSVRLAGDGPSSWTVWAMVARPRSGPMAKAGTLPGAYMVTIDPLATHANGGRGGGGRSKPLSLMRALVHDYSRPGDLVCDPCAGYGSTLAAAVGMGRQAIGAEVVPEVHAEALRRLAGVQYVDLFDPGRAKQAGLGL